MTTWTTYLSDGTTLVEEICIMRVERSNAVQLLQALGLPIANEWPNFRLTQKLEALADVDDLKGRRTKVTDKGLRNLLDSVLETLGKDNPIQVVDDVVEKPPSQPPAKKKPRAKVEDAKPEEREVGVTPVGDDGTSGEQESKEKPTRRGTKKKARQAKLKKAAAKPSKNGKEKRVKKKPSVAKKGPTERDQFGSRLGTRKAKINALMVKTDKPLTLAEIEDALPKVRAVATHMYWMVKTGFAKKHGKGRTATYRVVLPKSKKKTTAAV